MNNKSFQELATQRGNVDTQVKTETLKILSQSKTSSSLSP